MYMNNIYCEIVNYAVLKVKGKDISHFEVNIT